MLGCESLAGRSVNSCTSEFSYCGPGMILSPALALNKEDCLKKRARITQKYLVPCIYEVLDVPKHLEKQDAQVGEEKTSRERNGARLNVFWHGLG